MSEISCLDADELSHFGYPTGNCLLYTGFVIIKGCEFSSFTIMEAVIHISYTFRSMQPSLQFTVARLRT